MTILGPSLSRLQSLSRLGFSPSLRNAHFLSSVPLRKRGVDGDLPKDYFKEDQPVILYFSAGWCPSCRQLTPKLAKFHSTIKDRDVHIVWVSRDKTEEDQLDYYERKLPDWEYVPFGDENVKAFMDKYGVKTIPALRLVDAKGKVVSDEIRKHVEEGWKKDPEGVVDKWAELCEKQGINSGWKK